MLTKEELEKQYETYGKIVSCWLELSHMVDSLSGMKEDRNKIKEVNAKIKEAIDLFSIGE